MAQLKPLNASVRIINADDVRVCSVLHVAHDAAADKVANFVEAIETIYNNGLCTARMNIALEVVRR
jgi:hypothetical protein